MKESRLDSDGVVLPLCLCPTCGYTLDAATHPTGDRRPRPGDISLCLKCGEVLAYTETMEVIAASVSDLMSCDDDTRKQIDHIQQTIRKHRVKG